MHKVLSNKWVIFSLVLPGFLLFLFAIFLPIFLSGYFGMTDWSGVGKPVFVGLKNFQKLLFDDPIFYHSLFNALKLGLGLILIQHPLSMLFAILLDKISGKAEKFYRAAFFVPNVISVVVTSAMWVSMFNPDYGLINAVLKAVGLGFLRNEWLGDEKTALGALIFICAWQGFGWAMLLYYAGLKGIPEELYEAAKLDGASWFNVYTRITFPLMTPVIRINITLAMIAALKTMETVFLTTGGGPGDRTQFLANYLYVKAFQSFEYGYGNAISVVFVIVCLLVTYLLNKYIKTDVGEY